MAIPFIINQIYKRSTIHDQFGGSRQSGICPSSIQPYIFIFSGSSGHNGSLTNMDTTTAWIKGKLPSSCNRELTDKPAVIINPVYNETAVTSICEGDSIMLGGLYQKTEGIYTDYFTTRDLCDSIVQTTLTVNELPSVNLGADTTIGTNDAIILDAGSFNSYLWYEGSTTQPISVDSTGIGLGSGSISFGRCNVIDLPSY